MRECSGVAVVSIQGTSLYAGCRHRFAERRCRLAAAGVDVAAFTRDDLVRLVVVALAVDAVARRSDAGRV